MGCWSNDEGGLTCDGACDFIGDWLNKKFGKDWNKDKEKEKAVFNKMISDKKLFMSLYNEAKKYFVEIDCPENDKIHEEIRRLGYPTGKKYRDLEKKIKYQDMTVREFIGHLLFCTGSPYKMYQIKTPAFAAHLDKGKRTTPKGMDQIVWEQNQGGSRKRHQTGEPDLTDMIRGLL